MVTVTRMPYNETVIKQLKWYFLQCTLLCRGSLFHIRNSILMVTFCLQWWLTIFCWFWVIFIFRSLVAVFLFINSFIFMFTIFVHLWHCNAFQPYFKQPFQPYLSSLVDMVFATMLLLKMAKRIFRKRLLLYKTSWCLFRLTDWTIISLQ